MARDTCLWCCNPEELTRDDETFKAGVFFLLCDIVTNTSGGGASGAVNITQYGGVNTSLGQKAMAASIPVVIASDQSAIPVTATFTPSGTQNVNLTQVAGVAVSQGHGTAATAIRVELPTDGTGVVGLNAGTNVIGHVINDASSAVIGHVITDTGSTTAVTGNVTVVQATGTNLHVVNDAGSAIIGKVGIDQTTPGTTNLVALAANQSVNISQMNGVTVSMGAGASGTGTQRVVLANDGGKTIVSTGGSAASSGNNTLLAAGTNKLKVSAFSLSTTSTTSILCIFQSGAGGTELWRVRLQAITGSSTGANLAVPVPSWLFATASATLLNLNLSSANAVDWSVTYVDEV